MLSVSYLVADRAYISSGEEDNGSEGFYWLEGPARLEVNNQEGQIRIGVVTEEGRSEDVGLYFSPARARDLVIALAGAISRAEEASA